jgi:hypothetical protein
MKTEQNVQQKLYSTGLPTACLTKALAILHETEGDEEGQGVSESLSQQTDSQTNAPLLKLEQTEDPNALIKKAEGR